MTVRECPEIQLKITGIDFKRLGDIERNTWEKDGVIFTDSKYESMWGVIYRRWDSFYERSIYGSQPWVWVIEFELEKKGQEDDI